MQTISKEAYEIPADGDTTHLTQEEQHNNNQFIIVIVNNFVTANAVSIAWKVVGNEIDEINQTDARLSTRYAKCLMT